MFIVPWAGPVGFDVNLGMLSVPVFLNPAGVAA